MVRGLRSHWKQSVYFDFEQDMTRNILFEVITAMENTGFLVVAMVCDPSPKTTGSCGRAGRCQSQHQPGESMGGTPVR